MKDLKSFARKGLWVRIPPRAPRWKGHVLDLTKSFVYYGAENMNEHNVRFLYALSVF